MGVTANYYWTDIPDHFGNSVLDEFVVMPNHIHGIIIINIKSPPPPYRFEIHNNHPEFAWQSRFHDRIIRDENELCRIRKYIMDNPLQWENDNNNRVE